MWPMATQGNDKNFDKHVCLRESIRPCYASKSKPRISGKVQSHREIIDNLKRCNCVFPHKNNHESSPVRKS